MAITIIYETSSPYMVVDIGDEFASAGTGQSTATPTSIPANARPFHCVYDSTSNTVSLGGVKEPENEKFLNAISGLTIAPTLPNLKSQVYGSISWGSGTKANNTLGWVNRILTMLWNAGRGHLSDEQASNFNKAFQNHTNTAVSNLYTTGDDDQDTLLKTCVTIYAWELGIKGTNKTAGLLDWFYLHTDSDWGTYNADTANFYITDFDTGGGISVALTDATEILNNPGDNPLSADQFFEWVGV